MLKRIPLWIVLNCYAFLLDALSILLLGAGYFFYSRGNPVFPWILFPAGALVAVAAVTIHGSYPMKRHLFLTLTRRNRKEIHFASFEDFVDVPCHRMIVRAVLAHLDRSDCYREVLRRYYVLPWKRMPMHSPSNGSIIFSSHDEYLAWQKTRK